MMKKRSMLINALDRKSHINREIYGHFSEHLGRCIYNGINVGEGSAIPGNVGSGTVQELTEWIEYITSDDDLPMANLRRHNGREKPWKLKYLGVGNENWGCGGKMHPEFYTNQYLRYSTYCHNYGDNQLFKAACGPDNDNYHWTEQVMRGIGKWNAQTLSLHYYTVTRPGISKGSATDFTRDEYCTTIAMTLFIDELINRHTAIMTQHDPDNTMNLIIDEWGCWFDVEPGTNPGFLY